MIKLSDLARQRYLDDKGDPRRAADEKYMTDEERKEYLPSAGSAEKHIVVRVGNTISCCIRQSRIVYDPPDESMGIKQDTHTYSKPGLRKSFSFNGKKPAREKTRALFPMFLVWGRE